jgi:hypothetical protein
MVKRSIQGYVELASGFGEMTRSKALGAAQELLALAGADDSRKKLARVAGRLADDLLRAADHNRRQVTDLVQREVESAITRLDLRRVLAEVEALSSAVAALTSRIDEVGRGDEQRGESGVSVGTAAGSGARKAAAGSGARKAAAGSGARKAAAGSGARKAAASRTTRGQS